MDRFQDGVVYKGIENDSQTYVQIGVRRMMIEQNIIYQY